VTKTKKKTTKSTVRTMYHNKVEANTPVRKQNTILESTNGPREKKDTNISQHQRLMTLKVVRWLRGSKRRLATV